MLKYKEQGFKKVQFLKISMFLMLKYSKVHKKINNLF